MACRFCCDGKASVDPRDGGRRSSHRRERRVRQKVRESAVFVDVRRHQQKQKAALVRNGGLWKSGQSAWTLREIQGRRIDPDHLASRLLKPSRNLSALTRDALDRFPNTQIGWNWMELDGQLDVHGPTAGGVQFELFKRTDRIA